MKETAIVFPCGEISLEGVLCRPERGGIFPAVVVCHPHPLYGGSIDNNVVGSICTALVKTSMIAFKFNFRGVGKSQGNYDNGVGEQDDVAAAISFIGGVGGVESAKIGLVGYSAGAGYSFPVGVRDDRVAAIALISPPLDMFDFRALKEYRKPALLITGARDEFTPPDKFEHFCRELNETVNCERIEVADHFWWGYEIMLAEKVADFMADALAEKER